MQYFPNQLKEKLVKALDKDNNVVDMPAVLEVISSLEKCTLTREDLEQTRIGKIVNELRKKTNDRDMAKRAKNLVKRWQALITAPQPTVNGEGIAVVRAGLSSKPASPALSRLSPASTGSSKPASPAIQRLSPKTGAPGLSPKLPLSCQKVSAHKQVTSSNGRTHVTPVSPATVALAGQSRLQAAAGVSTSPRLNSNHVSHGNHQVKNSQSENYPNLSKGRGVNHNEAPPNLSRGGGVIHNEAHNNKTSRDCGVGGQMLSKTNAANKKRRRTPDPNSPGEIPSKKQSLQTEGGHADQNGTKAHTVKDGEGISGSVTKLKRTSSAPDMVNGMVSNRHVEESGRLKDWHHKRVDSPVLRVSQPGAVTSPATPLSRSSDEAQSFAAKRNVNLLLKTPDQSVDKTDKSGSASKTPKVKTTAQLIAELQAKQGGSSFGSATISKIAQNQIDKEPDDILQSVVPASAKPRPRRKPGTEFLPPSTPTGSLSQTKTEMVRKFLQTSITPTSSDADLCGPFGLHHQNVKSETVINAASSATNMESLSDVEIDVECIDTPNSVPAGPPGGGGGGDGHGHWGPAVASTSSYAGHSNAWSRLPATHQPLGTELKAPTQTPDASSMNISDIYALLPPLNLDEINLEEEEDTYAEATPEMADVTQEALDRLEKERWEGVNGNFTQKQEWTDLTDTLPSTTYDGQPLVILPYVNIDD